MLGSFRDWAQFISVVWAFQRSTSHFDIDVPLTCTNQDSLKQARIQYAKQLSEIIVQL